MLCSCAGMAREKSDCCGVLPAACGSTGLDIGAKSAGPDPDSEVLPKVVEGLLQDGIDVRGYRAAPDFAGGTCDRVWFHSAATLAMWSRQA